MAFRYIYKLANSDESAEKLWEDQAWGADVKYTVTEGRQVVGRGYCQGMTTPLNWDKHTAPARGVVILKETSSFKIKVCNICMLTEVALEYYQGFHISAGKAIHV